MLLKVLRSSLVVSLLSLASVSGAAEKLNSISVKTGSFTLANKSQRITTSTVIFDETSSSVFAFEYERSMRNRLTWGAEYISYTNDFSAATSHATATHLALNIKQYFDVAKNIQPFIGAGVTAAAVRLGGLSSGRAGGLGFQAMGGVKFPFDTISAVIEYKMTSAEPTDAAGSSVNTSGNGLFAGIAINF